MNYYDLLLKNRHKAEEFLITEKKIYTYKNIFCHVDDLRGSLLNKGITKKTVLIICKDIYDQFSLFLACMGAENVPIICHYHLLNEEINDIVNTNNIQCVICDRKINGLLNLEAFNKHLYIYNNKVIKDPFIKNVCMGVLSSGSTSVPKVFYRTYESWADFFKIQNEIFKVGIDSTIFINGSLSFTGNLNVLLSALFEECRIIVSSEVHPKTWINIIDIYNVTNIYMIPSKLRVLGKALKVNNNRVRCIFTGSEMMLDNVIKALKKYYVNSEIIMYYGASELSYVSYISGDNILINKGCVGQLFKNINVYIKDRKIHVETPYCVENIKCPFCIKDTGYIDENGFLFLEGRSDDIVNINGIKVSTYKIENKLKNIKGIDECAVVLYKSKEKFNKLSLFIKIDNNGDKAEINKLIHEKLNKSERPAKIIFLENMPHNDSGKINKKILKLNHNL